MGASAITSISLYNENGAVVAGPVDAVADGVSGQKVTFTDTVTYPIGKHTYTLKGKIPTTAVNGAIITTTTTPSTDWANITGQTTGSTITITNGLVTMNAMTVKSAALVVTQSTSPTLQTIVGGSTSVTFANFLFAASQSGEDVRFASVGLTLTAGAGIYTALTACHLFDGAIALNTGSNVVNPTLANAGVETFAFDQSLTVAKNTVKMLTLKCNVLPGTTGAFTWNMASSQIASMAATGVTSGARVVATTGL